MEVWDGKEWLILIDRHMKLKRWMHVSVVFEPDGRTYGYLDGSRQHLVQCGCDYAGVKSAIAGKFLNTDGNPYTGLMDDFRIYSRTLRAEEIEMLYSQAQN